MTVIEKMRIGAPGIAGRVFLYTAAIVALVLGAALLVSTYSSRRAARVAERRGLEQAADVTAQLLAGRGRTLAGGVRVFVQGPYFRSLVGERRREDILDQTAEAVTQLDASWAFITDERGTLIAKSDEPSAVGVAMGGIGLVAGALEGRPTSGFGVSRDTLLFQAAAAPIARPGTAPMGVLVATKLLDRQTALDVRAATGAEVVFYTLDIEGRAHVAATSLEHAGDAAAALPTWTSRAAGGRRADPAVAPAARTATLGGVPYALQGAGLTTAGGEIIAGFVVGRPESGTPAEMAGMRRSLLAAGALGLLLALAAAWSSARRVARPARALAAAAGHALEGEYDQAARLAARATTGSAASEVETLGAALGALVAEMRERQTLGAAVARADSFPGDAPEGVALDEGLPADDAERRRSRRPRHSGGSGGAGRRTPAAPAATPRALSSRWATRTVGPLMPGAVVADRYHIQDVVGVGESGIVYRATDRTLGQTVALKLLRLPPAPELVADDPRSREEMKRELRRTRRVSHRNVVRTYDFGTNHGVPFLSMEFVEGTSLSSVIAHRGALPADAVIALARQLTRALEAAHEQGIIHGDLKPANLLVAVDGLVKVTDFGVASLMRRPRAGGARAAHAASDDPVDPPRLAGAVIGTPEYMAPELLVGGAPDVRTDLYAAGMILHECLTGATPFQRDTPQAFLAQKLEANSPSHGRESPTPEDRNPRTLESLIAWMTASEPSDRPSSAAEVGDALSRLG